MLFHLFAYFGEKTLMNHLVAGKSFEELYSQMPKEDQQVMGQNLLAYGASIQESDLFLYEKV